MICKLINVNIVLFLSPDNPISVVLVLVLYLASRRTCPACGNDLTGCTAGVSQCLYGEIPRARYIGAASAHICAIKARTITRTHGLFPDTAIPIRTRRYSNYYGARGFPRHVRAHAKLPVRRLSPSLFPSPRPFPSLNVHFHYRLIELIF